MSQCYYSYILYRNVFIIILNFSELNQINIYVPVSYVKDYLKFATFQVTPKISISDRRIAALKITKLISPVIIGKV